MAATTRLGFLRVFLRVFVHRQSDCNLDPVQPTNVGLKGHDVDSICSPSLPVMYD